MKVADKLIIEDGDMSADIESESLLLDQIYGFSFQAIYTGSPDGTLKLQASNDGETWDDVPSSSLIISAAGHTLYNVTDVFYKYVRVYFEFSSGSGSLNVYYFAKGV